jgi:mono/diheme cytochrome c family protein
MRMRTLGLAVVAGAWLVSLPGAAKDLAPLKSVRVKLPDNEVKFPPGPGSQIADSNCRRCHTTEMVLFQPAMTHAGWEAEVNKMRNVYKAPIDPKDVGTIVDYLTQLKGAP